MSSLNHHYVPKLYLRGFTAPDGKLQVFDKQLNKFKKDKQTPKTILFERHRNTIDFKGNSTDKIEKLYSAIESPLGDFFNHVRKGISHDELISEEGIYLLKLFISIQFWRMPIVDEYATSYVKNMDLKYFGRKITINGTPLGEVDEVRRLLDTDKGFCHYFRSFYLPLLTFDLRVRDSDFNHWRLHTVAKEEDGWENFLTGDNPIVIENLSRLFTFESKLFVPLSKNQLVSYSPAEGNSQDLPAIFTSKLAMTMNSQSQKYLVGTNREYMEKILELQGRVYGSNGDSKLRYELFEHI